MKKLLLSLAITSIFFATPTLAATKTTAKAVVPKVKALAPATPEGYSPITWAKAPGIASFFRAPQGNGMTDFLTRIYLPQNQIDFIVSSNTPIDLGEANPNFTENIASSGQINSASMTEETSTPSTTDVATTTSTVDTTTNTTSSYYNFRNFSFERLAAETAKIISPNAKFVWNAPFFNMKPSYSDLSMALKYTIGTSTTITAGARSIPDMAQPRKMLVINNKTGKALIKDFDAATFIDSEAGDQAIEGFAPTVLKSDSAGATAARLFMGVTDDGKELVVYCSQQATTEEASNALSTAGISIDNQLEADGGGSASCGYNLPGQYFVEPSRSLPILMGAVTVLSRGTIINKTQAVRATPSAKGAIVDKLIKGATIQVFEEKNGWSRIGDNQWILKTSIKKI